MVFQKKIILMLRSINWPNINPWLPFLLETGQYACCNYLLIRLWRNKFEINFIFLIKPFFNLYKNSRQKLNIMRTRRVFSFFIIFKGFSVSKNFLRLDSAPLMLWNSISSSRLKLTAQIQLVLPPCDMFLINNSNMTDNSVEK